MKKDFIKCGIIGWCIEVLFTSACCFKKKDYKLIGQTSVWMFPIYGMAAVIKPISFKLKARNKKTWERGLVYTVGIYATEYMTGMMLKKKNNCPWDYSEAKHNVNGVIRWDYAPLWFAVGLVYEKMLSR
jgi:uncharacterized membrane protein